MSKHPSTICRRSLSYIPTSHSPCLLSSRAFRLHVQRRSSYCRYFTASSASRSFSLRPYIYATTFTLVGLTAGQLLRYAYVPPAAPEPGTSEDSIVLKQKERDIDKLPIVQRLRQDGAWRELRTHVEAGQSKRNQGGLHDDELDKRSRTLTEAAMSGSRGLGVQRAFWDNEKGELVAIVWFGQGLSGWPGIAHGGAIATVLEEALRQVALGIDKDWTSLPEEPNTLNISYIKPTLANNFYVVRVTQSAESVTEQDGISPRKPGDRSLLAKEVDAILQTLDDRVLVKARGTFTLPGIAQSGAQVQKASKSAWQGPLRNLIPKWLT